MSDQKQQVQTEKESGARPAGGELWVFRWTTRPAELHVAVAGRSVEGARQRALETIRSMPLPGAGPARNLRRRVKECAPRHKWPAGELRILSTGKMVFVPPPQAQPQAEE